MNFDNPAQIGPLGARLADLRIALDISLRDGAKLCRIDVVLLGQIERGKVGIDVYEFTAFTINLLAPSRRRQKAAARRFAKRMLKTLGGG